MKKAYTTPDYKKWNNNKSKKVSQAISSRKRLLKKTDNSYRQFFRGILFAPDDFRVFEEPDNCLTFFRELRNRNNYSFLEGKKKWFVRMSLKAVDKIDYATISILTAICDDLKSNGVIIQGDFPNSAECTKLLQNSGYLNHIVDKYNKKFPSATKSDLIFFERGDGRLSEQVKRKLSALVKDVVTHLEVEDTYRKPINSIILEICGNSIEWGDKFWQLGVSYEENSVKFTITDVGKGILKTLHRRFEKKIFDLISTDKDILFKAFEQKYGSSTQEVNRNKGLPAVKKAFDNGTILNLIVLTNNVLLHFNNNSQSKTLPVGCARFKGTFYQWELTKECIVNQ